MSDAAPGLKVEATHRGFVVTLRAGSSVGGALGLVGLGLVVVCVGALIGGIVALDSPALAAMAVLPAAVGGALTLGAIAARRARINAGAGRLELDGERVRFLAVEGPADVPIEEMKGVDVVPVGLAVRVRGGGSWHFATPKVPPAGRTWLRDQLRAAAARHGRPDDVPDAIKELAPRGRAPSKEST